MVNLAHLPEIIKRTPAMKVQSRLPLTQWPRTQHKAPTACVNTASKSGAADRVTTSEITKQYIYKKY